MCSPSCLEFGRRQIGLQDVAGRRVIEVGALDFNGSLRSYIESLGPREYVGVDREAGPGVDQVCDAAVLAERFGPASFDLLVSTEMLEHVRHWRDVIRSFKNVLAPRGVLVATTRSRAFEFHGYPFDSGAAPRP